MCGIISIDQYEDEDRESSSGWQIIGRFANGNQRGLIVKDTDMEALTTNFFYVYAITSDDGADYQGFFGESAVQDAQAYMADHGFISTSQATAPAEVPAEQAENNQTRTTYEQMIDEAIATTEEEEDALLASLR